MPTIYNIGETICDIIFDHDQPKVARPGGSMLNTAVSLGRCGLHVEMLTELGRDQVGKLVLDFLKENGVSTSFIRPVDGFNTPVALAFLDEQGNAQYSFYKNYPEDRLKIPWPGAGRGDVVLFGSFYSLDQAIRDKIVSFVRKAKRDGGLIVYDPNIRKNHLDEIRKLMHLVEENISLADIVRGSDEDFENLFGIKDSEMILEQVREIGCRHLIVTRGSEGADLFSDEIRMHVPASGIEVVSTIGAGDAFNAGLIYGLVKMELALPGPVHIKKEAWTEIIELGIIFAADVCRSYDNYISKEFCRKLYDTK